MRGCLMGGKTAMSAGGAIRRTVLLVIAAILGCIVAPVRCGAAPQQNGSGQARRSAAVTLVSLELVVDGVLDEAPWQTAPKIGDLIQREPRNGETPSERTDVTLLHDANNLYIGVMCYDSEPDKVIGTQMARDAILTSDDRISIVLDTYRDQRNAFYFSTNPAGALVDGLVFANGQSNNEWDAIWTVRTRRTERGMERGVCDSVQEPQLSCRLDDWGFNLSRNIHRKLEEDRWSGREPANAVPPGFRGG